MRASCVQYRPAALPPFRPFFRRVQADHKSKTRTMAGYQQ